MISTFERPVRLSVLSLALTPSSISTNLTFPETSAIIGLVKGSHLAKISPGLTLEPLEKLITVP